MTATLESELILALIDDDLTKFDTRLRTAFASADAAATINEFFLSSILIQAIRRGNARAVRLLLEDYHAVPQPVLDKSSPKYGFVAYPLAEALSYSRFAGYLVEDSSGNRVSAAHEILRLLLAFGASFQRCREHNMLCPLFHHIFTLATNAPDAASFLLKALPPSTYVPHLLPGVSKCHSPLDSFLRYFVPSYLSHRELIPFLKMLKFAVLPLLRLGAHICDSFSDVSSLFNLLTFDSTFSVAIWGRPNMLSRMFIEATWTSELKLPSSYGKTSPSSAPSFNAALASSDAYLRVLRSEYPRSLQSQCRTAALRCLPPGPTRLLAIQSLELPTCLSDYLNFSDYEIE